MAQRRESRMVIGGTAMTSGLDLSAGRDVVDETQLWEVEGMYANEDKVLAKRPSFVRWATQIAEPKTADSGENEEIAKVLFLNEEDWGVPVVTGSSASAVYDNSAIVLSGWESNVTDGPGTASIERTLKDQEAFNTSVGFDSSLTLSFVVQVKDPSLGEFITFEAAVEEDMLKGWAIGSGGLAMQTGASTYSTILGTEVIVDGNPHRVDLTLASGIALDVWVDGVKISSGNVQTYSGLTSDYFMKLTAKSQATLPTTPFVLTMSSIILKDTAASDIADVLDFPTITDLSTVRELKSASFTDVNSLLVAGSTYLWYDYGLREIWRPLAVLPKPNTRFSQFRGNTIICNYSDSSRVTHVFEYDQGQVTDLTDAPDMRFTTEFTNRIWGAGDVNHPLRVYYSGDRQSNTWHNPSDPNIPNTEDSAREAGFVEFPGDDKARIRHLFGDFFGMLLVATDKEVWLVSGTSPADYQKKRLTGAISAAGDLCGIDVFNDYWLMGKDGISSVQTTDKFGDIEGKKMSALARELFNTDSSSGRMLDPNRLFDSKMVYYPKFNTMILYSEESGKEVPGVFYAMNIESGKWSGPWREQCTALRVVTLASPVKDMVAIGTSDGYVKYMTSHVSNTDTAKISSPVITGRSIDPKLDSMIKTWGRLRLKITPTGNWDVTIRWKTDDEEWHETTKKLMLPSHHLVGSTAVTGTSFAKSKVQPMLIEIPLDTRGLSLKYEITTNAPWFKPLRWEVDFSAAGYERD